MLSGLICTSQVVWSNWPFKLPYLISLFPTHLMFKYCLLSILLFSLLVIWLRLKIILSLIWDLKAELRCLCVCPKAFTILCQSFLRLLLYAGSQLSDWYFQPWNPRVASYEVFFPQAMSYVQITISHIQQKKPLIPIFFMIPKLGSFNLTPHIPFKAFQSFFYQQAQCLFALLISVIIKFQFLSLFLTPVQFDHWFVIKDFPSWALFLSLSFQD